MTKDPVEQTAAAVITDTAIDYPQPELPEFEPVTTPQSPIHTAFVAAVKARVAEILGPVGVPEDLIEPFAEAFAEEMDAIITKFARGQIKHGGDIRDRDLLLEATHEARDMLVYFIVMRLQRATIRCPISV